MPNAHNTHKSLAGTIALAAKRLSRLPVLGGHGAECQSAQSANDAANRHVQQSALLAMLASNAYPSGWMPVSMMYVGSSNEPCSSRQCLYGSNMPQQVAQCFLAADVLFCQVIRTWPADLRAKDI